MKKFILILFLKDTKQALLLVDKLYGQGTNTVTVEGDKHVVAFKSNDTLSEAKNKLMAEFERPPLFFLIDGDKQGDTFEMNFTQLEPIILMEQTVDDIFPTIEAESLTLDDLLDLMTKNGYSALTDKQKARLKKLSEE